MSKAERAKIAATGVNGTVKIGAHFYEVKEEGEGGLMPSAAGSIHFDPCKIYVRKDATASRRVGVFLHELTHGIVRPFNFKKNTEERICLAVEEGMVAFLRDNPEYVVQLLNLLQLDDSQAEVK